MEAGQYKMISMPMVQNAGGSCNDGRSNTSMSVSSAVQISIINPASTIKYVKKYRKKDSPFTRSWFLAFICGRGII